MGADLFAVRLDTPGSRRGNFAAILDEVRWELDLRGYGHVKLFVSGGIDEGDIVRLNRVADGYGVGTSIASAPSIDFSLDIVEVNGRPLAKRGKRSGAKRLIGCTQCGRRWVIPRAGQTPDRCDCGGSVEDLLGARLQQGTLVSFRPSPQEIRAYVLEQLESVSAGASMGKSDEVRRE